MWIYLTILYLTNSWVFFDQNRLGNNGKDWEFFKIELIKEKLFPQKYFEWVWFYRIGRKLTFEFEIYAKIIWNSYHFSKYFHALEIRIWYFNGTTIIWKFTYMNFSEFNFITKHPSLKLSYHLTTAAYYVLIPILIIFKQAEFYIILKSLQH